MNRAMLTGLLDELEKIGIAGASAVKESFGKVSDDAAQASGEQATGDIGNTPTRPGEVKQPITPTQMKPKVIDSPSGRGTNYTRSNVEAPGTDVTVTLPQKNVSPPPIRV